MSDFQMKIIVAQILELKLSLKSYVYRLRDKEQNSPFEACFYLW